MFKKGGDEKDGKSENVKKTPGTSLKFQIFAENLFYLPLFGSGYFRIFLVQNGGTLR